MIPGDRIHLRTDLIETLFTRALGGTVKAVARKRVYVAFDDGSFQWVKLLYIYPGDAPDHMRKEPRE